MDNSLTEIKNNSTTKQILAQKVEAFQKRMSKERNEKKFKKTREQFRQPLLLQDNLQQTFDFDDLEFEEEEMFHINSVQEMEADLQEFYEKLL